MASNGAEKKIEPHKDPQTDPESETRGNGVLAVIEDLNGSGKATQTLMLLESVVNHGGFKVKDTDRQLIIDGLVARAKNAKKKRDRDRAARILNTIEKNRIEALIRLHELQRVRDDETVPDVHVDVRVIMTQAMGDDEMIGMAMALAEASVGLTPPKAIGNNGDSSKSNGSNGV